MASVLGPVRVARNQAIYVSTGDQKTSYFLDPTLSCNLQNLNLQVKNYPLEANTSRTLIKSAGGLGPVDIWVWVLLEQGRGSISYEMDETGGAWRLGTASNYVRIEAIDSNHAATVGKSDEVDKAEDSDESDDG
ncbi:MAG: hypothetical protein IIC60_08040 [Proteobacteria bacterium]|nr:hypothetical protein [Pseudomonadota bacterium]